MTKEDLILEEIRRLQACLAQLSVDFNKLSIEVAQLQVKSGVWGFAAGLLPALGIVLYLLIG